MKLPTRLSTRFARAAAAVVSLQAALAIADETPEPQESFHAALRVGVEAWPQIGGESVARVATVPSAEGVAAPSVIDARVWLGGQRVSIGVGLNSASPAFSVTAGRAPVVIVGLRYQLSAQSGSYLDSAPAVVVRDGRAVTGRDVRVGLEFKPARSNAGMARGTLLRMQLNSDSQLLLRLRGGGLKLMLRSQF